MPIILTFTNSKLPAGSFNKQNQIYQKSKLFKISSTNIIYTGEDLEFVMQVFYWCITLDHETYTKCKKKHLT